MLEKKNNKPFCIHGHDLSVVGRLNRNGKPTGRCKACVSLASKEEYRTKHPNFRVVEEGYCMHGHVLCKVGTNKRGGCLACESINHKKYNDRVGLQRTLRDQCTRVGITVEFYNLLPKICTLCGTDKPGTHKGNWCKDHDHSTGRFRGLLCRTCNIKLGYLEKAINDPIWLTKVRSYLRPVQS